MSIKFTKIIAKKPCRAMTKGISEAGLGVPDYEIALKQHRTYTSLLESLGLSVTVLEGDERFPDSTFIEDTAIVSERGAIITRPGASSRMGEIGHVRDVLEDEFERIESINAPGTCDGGDVMRVGNIFYIGLSDRTNADGSAQLTEILNRFGFEGRSVEMARMLHLKTGLSYLENNVLLIAGEFQNHKVFDTFDRVFIPEAEAYAANSLWINGTVIVPDGFPRTRELIEAKGFTVKTIDISEFRKLDGGLSCLSLRY